ncbi:MAG: adenylosuccinate synthase [Phycisphaeraceae bacterium]|nr:adenylosuccinate synthase [Phycisphaeraceae bacterium]
MEHRTNTTGECAAVIGLQWGDEGKGKLVDLLAPDYAAVVRYNGGANAGHSVVVGGERYALHLVPSGILYPDKLAVIGNGVVVDPEVLLRELDGLAQRGVDVSGLVLSDRAHVVMPYHKAEDELRERVLSSAQYATKEQTTGRSIGTTKRGIGPCYADKAQRATAIRAGDLLRPEVLRRKVELACAIKNAMLRGLAADDEAPEFKPAELIAWASGLGKRLERNIKDTTYLLHDLRSQGKRVLFEGANAAMLDVDHGTYPYVTSSSCTAGGIPAGTGVPGSEISSVLGVVKAYSTRVGNGPLVTELFDETGNRIRERGREFGTTTGRPRRVGWLDLVAVKYSAMLSGASGLAVTLLDVLAGLPTLRVCTEYRVGGRTTDRFLPDGDLLEGAEPVYTDVAGFEEDIGGVRSRRDLPPAAKVYLDLIERMVGVRVAMVGVGPERSQTIRG